MTRQQSDFEGDKAQITYLTPEPEKKEEDDDFPQSLEEALLGE